MGELKLEAVDKWLSKILPPHDLPQRDILNEMEPVHAAESGAFEEVGYTVRVTEDDISAESIQRSARKFGTQPPAPKTKKKATKKKREDKFTFANRILKNYLATQKFIKLRPNYHVFVQEYLERHTDEMPFKDASFVKLLQQTVFGKVRNITSNRLVDISGGREKPKSYRCLVLVPIGFIPLLQGTMLQRNMLTALLIHEIEGHCRDLNPQSAFWRLARRTGLVQSAVGATNTNWQDTLRPYLELSAQIEGIDFMMTKLQFAKNPNIAPKPVREGYSQLVGKCASAVLLKLSSMDRNKRELVTGFFKERMARASKETRNYFRKILQEDYNFNDKSISQIGL